jgi:phenylalanyl-tRNA synthetase beta chain
MIISLNWLKKYVDINIPTDELVKLIGARLVEVESASDISEKYKGVKIVEVKSAEKIESSDHLHRCMIWDGENEVQVVCGAPNVRTGMLAVWLPPGVTLPTTWNEEPLVLAKRKLMGVESNGMLAGTDELGFGDVHEAIAEVDPNMLTTAQYKDGTWPRGGRKVEPGDDFAAVFDLNDTLLDIENKSLTHRPDCFGIIGFAREVAGILGQKFHELEWFVKSEEQSR